MLVLDIGLAAVGREWWRYSCHSACGKVSSASSLLRLGLLCLLTNMLHDSTSRLMILNISHSDTNHWTYLVIKFCPQVLRKLLPYKHVYTFTYPYCVYTIPYSPVHRPVYRHIVLAETCLAQWLTLYNMYGPAFLSCLYPFVEQLASRLLCQL